MTDPDERRDLAAGEDAVVRELLVEHERFVAPAPPALAAAGSADAVPKDRRDVLENLKALGYIDD